jgi:hypothetical protein
MGSATKHHRSASLLFLEAGPGLGKYAVPDGMRGEK